MIFVILLHVIVLVYGETVTNPNKISINVEELQKFASQERNVIENDYSCKGIKGRNQQETDMLREQCKSMMKSSAMQLSLSKLREMDTMKLLKAKQEHYKARSKRSIIFTDNDEAECPLMDKAYLKGAHNRINMLSLSPFEAKVDYNPNRLPQYLSQDRCLCKGCINPQSGRETLDYRSTAIAIETDVLFHVKDVWIKRMQTLNVGCTCTAP